ncbi:MAG: response regulator [Nitrospira sp.]|nr:response regulator [Nitrospira sp.]MCA9479042.1 response regulator [Nitrospira sp.]MCB9709610.1 response regulator [Nitrospiraceae bacterium]
MTHQSASPQTVCLAQHVMSRVSTPLTTGVFPPDLVVQFLSGRFDGWPVVNSQHSVIGVLRESRLLQTLSSTPAGTALRVEEIMTTPACSVSEDDPLAVVLEKMVQSQVLRMPVVGEGRLVGVIARSQAVRRYCGIQASPAQIVTSCVWCERLRSPQKNPATTDGWSDQESFLSLGIPSSANVDLAHTYCPSCLNSLNTFLQKMSATLPAKAHMQTLPSPCVLVVDDDPSVVAMLREALEELGYEVCTACNGREGLRAVTTRAVDGILLDLDMPIMTGRTMLDELRWLESRVPVVMMSGGQDHKELKQFLREGAQGYLMKPFTLQGLKQICEQLFRANRMPDESERRRLLVAG